MTDFGLYFIVTNPGLPYRTLAQICVDRGIRYIQLREKELSDREILRAAGEILSVTKGTDTRFIMNDRADLALLSGADGIHLGQDDISPEQGLRLFPESKIIRGLSTHSAEQARTAWKKNPDYIGFGPVYPTPTKKNPDPAVGTDQLRLIVQVSPVPVIAIGGLFPNNLASVLEAGARNVCLVRHFMECRREEELLKRIDNIQDMIWEAAR